MQIFKSYLKLFLTFPLFIIRDNIGKSILILIAVISYQFLGTFEDTKCESPILETITIDKDTLYVYAHTAKETTFELVKSNDEDYEVVGNKLTWIESSDGNMVMGFLFFIPVISLVIMFFVGLDNDDVEWDIRSSWKDAVRSTVYTLYEENTYYYMSFGRLLGKRDYLIPRNNIGYELNVHSLGDVFYCPKFQTKTQNRENLLSKIGIK